MSYLRYPLNRILASEGAVRILRELCRHGDAMSVPTLTRLTHLHPETVRALLADLAGLGIVEPLGAERTRLYRVQTTHPLLESLAQLFAAEDARVQAVMGALRSAALSGIANTLAVWLFGSVARGQDTPHSDMDVALVIAGEDSEAAVEGYRAAIAPAMARQGVSASVIGLSAADVLRLAREDTPWWRTVARDAQPLVGLPPLALVSHLQAVQSQAA